MRTPIRSPRRIRRRALATLSILVLGGVLAAGLAACGATAPSAPGQPSASPSGGPSGTAAPATATAAPSAEATATPELTPVVELTPVPGATAEASEPGGNTGIIVIDWGTILGSVPEGFPVYPGAKPTEVADGPSSGAWFADGASPDDVAPWYKAQLEALGFTTENLSSPLEDGSRILDTVSDLPECRIQTTFQAAGGSTIIIVLYGAGCAGGEG